MFYTSENQPGNTASFAKEYVTFASSANTGPVSSNRAPIFLIAALRFTIKAARYKLSSGRSVGRIAPIRRVWQEWVLLHVYGSV